MDSPYAILTINLLILLAYLFSYLLSRYHFIRFSSHLKFWNIILLAALLLTGILGLILAIQVNLKISVSSADQLLFLHVNAGIGLFVVAVIHVSRHLNYFGRLLKRDVRRPFADGTERIVSANPDTSFNGVHPSGKLLVLAIIATGASAMSTQLIMIKALLAVFNGNELVIGIILANWMLLTGLGAYTAKKRKTKALSENSIIQGISFLSFVPLGMLFLIPILRNLLFMPGSMVSVWQITGTTFILLAPFCLWSGYFFILLSLGLSGVSKKEQNRQSYLLESIGGLTGGILFSFLFVHYFDPFQSQILLAIFNLTLLAYGLMSGKRSIKRLYPALLMICILAVIWLLKPDLRATQLLYRGQKVIDIRDTPFSRLVVTKTAEQDNFYEDGNLIFADNAITIEETVHYAMVQSLHPRRVLLIGGGMSGTINEILKYPIQSLTYFELDPELVKLGEKYLPTSRDKRLQIITGDARILIPESPDRFDIAIVDQPPPLSMQLNRYYSLEFFKLLKSKLSRGAVVSISLMPTAEYVSDEAIQLHSVMLATLRQVFRNVLVITGDRNYMLSSDNPLHSNIAGMIGKLNISTEYVNAYYLDDRLLTDRSQAVMKRIAIPAPINHDLRPVAYFLQQNYWLSYFHNSLLLPLILIILLASVLLFKMNSTQSCMFISGFSAASVEILLILASQVLYGYVYKATGIIITACMAGLALGAFSAKQKPLAAISRIQLLVGAFILVILIFLRIAESMITQHAIVWFGIPLLMLIMAYITGMQFGVASEIRTNETGALLSRIYSADLSGAALGVLLTATVLLPGLGLTYVLFLLAGINLAVGLLMSVKKN